MPFAAVYIPDFSVQAVVRLEPELRERPLAVLEGKPPVVVATAVNEKAAEAGVEPGMTKLQLTGTGVELRTRSLPAEAAAHAALLDCAQAFSPRVEDTAADTVVLDISGLERLFGPLAKLARELSRRAAELGLEANVAVATNPDAAIHAARGLHPGSAPEKLRVIVLPPGKERERLEGLPVDVLQLSPEMLETLDRWGVRTFRALAALPEVAISERLGQEGLRLQKLARGAVERALVPAEPQLVFEETMELEYPVALLEPLAFILGRLLEQLGTRLGARALATNELRLRLELDATQTEQAEARNEKLETRNEQRYSLRLPVPMLDSKTFLKLLQLELRAHPPQAPVIKVTLAAEPARLRAAQGGLFLPETPAPDRLELTLARLRGIAGDHGVGAAKLLDTHRPDAFRMTSFAPSAPGRKPSTGQPGQARLKPTQSCGPVMALRVFRPALPAVVEERGGAPARIAAAEPHGEVVAVAGPWRISGEWWCEEKNGTRLPGSGWARDEWDIVLANGEAMALYRIYRDLGSGKWFVEGQYD